MYHCISHQHCLSGIVAFNLILLSTQGIFVSVTAVTAKTILGNEGSTAQITYMVPLGVDASSIHCTWSHDGNQITIDDVKYVQPGPRNLHINNVVATDEGMYRCHYNYNQQEVSADVANIYVMWAAVFTEQEASVTSAHVGGTARFDVRVAYVGGGPQQRKQKVNLLQLFKDRTQVYRCRNWSSSETSPCTSMGRFSIEMQGSEKFDFYTTLNDVRVEDGGNYEARLEVIHPVTGSYLSFRKTITLNVTVALNNYAISATVVPPLPPTINIEARGEPNVGETFSLWCNVSLVGDATVGDITVSWQNPTGTVIKSTTTSTYLDIQLQNLSKDDEGLYTCTATVRMQGSEEMLTANASMAVVINETLSEVESFQLCIGPFFLSDCSALAVDSKKGRELENEIREEITRNVFKRCPGCANHGTSESFIQPGILRCSNDAAARLIYRSNIEVTEARNASELVQIIEEWVTSTVPGEATLQLWPFVMDLDSRCPVSITSLDSPNPALGTGGSQVSVSRTKEHIESCLAQAKV